MSDIATKIQILDDTTANQIAAGEVVERPAAAVKELVENALDAGASRVLVELEEGGKYVIRVTDDGCGMGPEDAVLALQRHATSKIASADDLFRITTMGFRGEALPSIASVSQFTLATRLADAPVDSPGIELHVTGGSVESVTEVGARPGTSITVENLFFNVPARLKFLKSTSTELSHIVELIQRFALAYPEVAFRLMNDGREAFTSPGNGGTLDACVHVFGRDTARQLAPIDYEAGSLWVTGFIGTPPTLRNTRAAQHTFVNRRFIRNKAVTRALDEAYKSVQTIHGTKFPPAVLLIEIEPSLVDVNVSPTKTEVRFTREGEVYSAVYHGVREALLAGGLVATLSEKQVRGSASDSHAFAAPLLDVPAQHPVRVRDYEVSNGHSRPFVAPPGDSPTAGASSHESSGTPLVGASPNEPNEFTGSPSPSQLADPFDDAVGGTVFAPNGASHIRERMTTREYGAGVPAGSIDETGPVTPLVPEPSRQEHPADTPLSVNGAPRLGADYRGKNTSSIRILAQTRNTYIVAQTDKALLVIDQHIAHERVLYEKLLKGAQTGAVAVQRLILPFTLELSRREAMVVEKRLPELARAGFELEAFGGDSFVVRSIPASIAEKRLKAQDGPEAVLKQIVEEMVEKSVSRKLLLPAEEVLITASCKMAVKAGDPLTFDEMQALVDDLFKSENPYTCPHGRPIILEMSNTELDRKFGR
jgi:DNA mismatch repair protein MutL